MARNLVFIVAALVLAVAVGAMPDAGQAADDAAAVDKPKAGPDVSRIKIRRPRGDVVEPEKYRRHLTYERPRGQHFTLDGTVNGHPLEFVFDTGASTVALTYDDARAAGLRVDRLRFSYPVMTANGVTKVAPVVLHEMTIGTIKLARVRAVVAAEGALDSNLLGNTFLNRLGSYSVDGDRLILRP